MKDLNLMISEAKRMANTFRAFEGIPRVLELLQSSTKALKDLDEQEKKRGAEIEALGVAKDQAGNELEVIKKKILEKREILENLGDEVATARAKRLDEMNTELSTIQEEIDKELSKSNDEKKDKIAANNKAVKASKLKMDTTIKAHKDKIAEFEAIVKDSEKRAKKAVADFEKIKESLLGGK